MHAHEKGWGWDGDPFISWDNRSVKSAPFYPSIKYMNLVLSETFCSDWFVVSFLCSLLKFFALELKEYQPTERCLHLLF